MDKANFMRIARTYLWKYHPHWMINYEWKSQGKHFNWKSPQDLNEKILWLAFNTDTKEWTRLADKYKVREHVRRCGFSDLLVDLYGKYDDANDINFDILPEKFVLKCNHDCGSVHIIDKTRGFDREFVKFDLNSRVRKPFGADRGELHYTKISPCIIAEEFLENTCSSTSSSLVDYKVWCFNGKPYCIFVVYDREPSSMTIECYDLNWHNHPEWLVGSSHFIVGGGKIMKPKSFEKMLNAASILSEGHPQVRVDFYDVDGKLYFGEMTFTSGEGKMTYFKDSFLKTMGAQIVIPQL